jgi:hypothetical protein
MSPRTTSPTSSSPSSKVLSSPNFLKIKVLALHKYVHRRKALTKTI